MQGRAGGGASRHSGRDAPSAASCRAYLRRGAADAGALNGSIQAGDAGCQVVTDAARDRGARRVVVAREYEVIAGGPIHGTWRSVTGVPPNTAMQAAVFDGVASFICAKTRAGRPAAIGRVASDGRGCVIVTGGRVTVLPAYAVLVNVES